MDKKTIIELITVSLAFLALVIAFVSWKTSQKNLKLAIESYEFQNRPWLLVNIKKDEETQRYFNIVKEDNSIYWKIYIVIENKGLSPAKDIQIPSFGNLKDSHGTNETAPMILDKIVLGQGQKYVYTLSFGGEFKGDLEELYKGYVERDKDLDLSFFVNYKGMINSEKEYKTKMNYHIEGNAVSSLDGSDFK